VPYHETMTATLERPLAPFKNEPIKDFTDPADVVAMRDALAKVKAQFGKHYPVAVDGQPLETQRWINSINPANPGEIVGIVGSASLEQASGAIEVAAKTFESWKKTGAKERAGYLLKAAELIRRRRFELNAWLVYEVGKSWPEADGDTAEAIDFLEFYAREALRYDGPHPVEPVAGEQKELRYIPLGAGVVIPPWNFAFAIMAGMSSAAIVAGNTVVLKPSSDSPVIAAKFVELMEEAGVPKGVFNFVPGSGTVIGDAIVLEMMRFGTELIDPSEFSLPSAKDVKPQELKMAEQLVAQFATTFDGSKYTDDYHDNLMKIIKAKMKGKRIDVAEPEERESTQVVDLMARLQESLDMGKKRGAGRVTRVAKTAKRVYRLKSA